MKVHSGQQVFRRTSQRSGRLGQVLLFTILLLAGGGVLWAGPFGLEMGMTLAQIEAAAGQKATDRGENNYTIKAPKPHTAFIDEVLIRISPESGLCKFIAIGKTIETSGYGTALKSEFESVKTQLIGIYGTPKVFDFLAYDSIWKDPDDWMMSLKLEERYLVAFWTSKDSSLPSDITGIKLEGVASSSTKGYITLGYEFSNFAASVQKQKAEDASVL